MKLRQVLLIFCQVLPIIVKAVEIRFTNLKCFELDPPFASFEKCNLKIVRRGVVALNVHVKLHQVPVNNISINVALFKKANGYRPFMYNVSADFCDFFRHQTRYPFLKIFLNFLLKDSNINHTCPYAHDIIVRNLVLEEYMFKYLPLPSGEYMAKLMVAAYKDWKADVQVHLRRIE